ncbi:MAG: hypothetical protein U0K87_00410 [Ruminococcus sp.]|nr:hypothetical protein [Acutalibacteraceae bacterium]MEE1170796.1 hypothetical protein [Ruminococcus sp.]
MKIRAYYGETDAYNYIRFVLGNKYMTFFDIINDIDICRENISEIVDSIKFDEWDYSDFIDCYEGVKNNRIAYNRDCGTLTVNELSEMLWETEKICESGEDYYSTGN